MCAPGRSAPRREAEVKMNSCFQCGSETEGKFCGHSCSATFNNHRRVEDRTCEKCGRNFRPDNKNPRCKNCRVHGRDKQFDELTNNGTRKKRLIAEGGHRCEVCKLSEWMGQPIPLEADHIDGNHQNTSRSNFRLICPNCHAQTPTYKGKNGKRSYASKVQKVGYSLGTGEDRVRLPMEA